VYLPHGLLAHILFQMRRIDEALDISKCDSD
jgi:hypothetical protein